MTSAVTCLVCLTIMCEYVNRAASFVDLKCELENRGEYGRQSLLECVIQLSKEAEGAEISKVVWKKDGNVNPLLFFREGKTKTKQRFQFAEPKWNNKTMNISLLVHDTKVSDMGRYICNVITDRGDSKASAQLRVTARYSVPTVRSIPETDIPQNQELTLFCNSYGGYPQGQIHWFDFDNHEWKNSSEMEAKKTEDGLFNLTSKLTLLSGSNFHKYTCQVYNASGSKEAESTFDVPFIGLHTAEYFAENPKSKIIAPVVVIGSLIVGLLLMIFLKRSHRRRDPVALSDEENGLRGGINM